MLPSRKFFIVALAPSLLLMSWRGLSDARTGLLLAGIIGLVVLPCAHEWYVRRTSVKDRRDVRRSVLILRPFKLDMRRNLPDKIPHLFRFARLEYLTVAVFACGAYNGLMIELMKHLIIIPQST